MDELLDTLLQTLLTIVPYDSACVLLTGTEGSFLVARQMPRETNRKNIVILEVSHYHFVQKVLMTRSSVFLENTGDEPETALPLEVQGPGFAFHWWCPNTWSDCFPSAARSRGNLPVSI